ncbi:bifunctional diguanylate cyclase/phosphodiesterase [Marinomonas balearica]|uniref:cyclic-guanylate-specific phosphodiesterase n=1 Tax=Marinomonas balearica TaxID=491947 RepID=A0A4R6M8W2_9GAMM|nr:EAL domain-containing protein [Marinomonas balearica]TDO97907.1 PAS domain S-box-containing protein/diguanylate cyclase (GGDEF)-like protein [Marinomonas balearica]
MDLLLFAIGNLSNRMNRLDYSVPFVKLVTVLSFVSFSILGGIAFHTCFSNTEYLAKEFAQHEAFSYANKIEKKIDQGLAATAEIVDYVRFNRGEVKDFESYASFVLERYPIVDRLVLIPNGIIAKIYPLTGHERVIGINLFGNDELRANALRDHLALSSSVSAPIRLIDETYAVGVRIPVVIEGTSKDQPFWGFVAAAFGVEKLIQNTELFNLEQHQLEYQLSEYRDLDETHVVISQSEGYNASDSIKYDMSLPSVHWTLSLSPSVAWVSNRYIYTLASSISLIVLMLTSVCFLIARKFFERSVKAQLVEQKTREAELTLERLSNTLDAIPDYLVEVDEKGVVAENHYSSEKGLMKWLPLYPRERLTECLNQEILSVWEQSMKNAFSDGTSTGLSFRVELDQDEKWFELSTVYTSRDESKDREAFYLFLARDITDRIKYEAELRIAAIAFETQDGIIITDSHNRIIKINKAFEKITGYSESEVFGKNPAIISSGRHDRNFYRKLYQSLNKVGHWEGEIWNRRKDGTIFPEWLYISAIEDDEKRLLHYVATFRDITKDKDNQHRIEQLNYYDELTRLPNKTLFLEELDHRLGIMSEFTYRRSAILYLDLDNFKDLNDYYGHKKGDELIQQVASRLVDVVRSQDMVSRLSGDNFVLLLEDADVTVNPERASYRAQHVADKILHEFKYPFVLEGKELTITASIGMTEFGAVKTEHAAEDVIKQAEMAMYEAKQSGRAQSCFFLPKMHERVVQRVYFETSLRDALAKRQFSLYYQPQFDVNKSLVGMEALIRWNHPDRGLVAPGEFIPFAEESKLIIKIGAWVLIEACQTKADWFKNGVFQDSNMSINVSALQFSQDNFVDQVKYALDKSGVNPSTIELELTESMLVDDQEDVIKKMNSLKELGVLISLDDFGTGYSSLSYLTRLPIDQLKIDQSFVSSLSDGTRESTIAASIINIGHNLNMEVIAEGVEQESQFEWLKSQGCDLFQGYGLGRPMPEDELLARFK